MKQHHPTRHRPGLVLLLALLVMAAITASTIAVSVVISTTASQSKNLDNFIIASLSADSGLERSLAVVKVGRQGSSLATATAAAAAPSTALGNNSSFGVTAAESSTPLTVPKLEAGQSFSFDILRPAVCPAAPAECPPSTLRVTGSDASTGTLDVSWVLIDANGNTNYSGREFMSNAKYKASAPVHIDLKQVRTENSAVAQPFTGSPTLLGYRVGVRAVAGSVDTVTATPYDVGAGSPGIPAQIPSNIAITSTGQAGATRSIKTASVLWQLPTSRLFNFVLFTEGPIIPCGSLEASC